MSGTADLCDLLFEVSNEDRLRMLLKLDEEPLNVTHLSRVLDLTTQEASRHLSRLSDVWLVEKDADGLHHPTPYGKLVIKQLTGLEFVSRHNEYFSSHTLGGLPPQFTSRIGELVYCDVLDHVMASLGNVEDGIREAEDYVWAVTDQYFSTVYRLLRDASKRDVTIRLIEAKDWSPLPQHNDDIRPEDAEAFNIARAKGFLQERTLEKLDFFLYTSEKEVAALAFPTLDGKFDYIGFSSRGEHAHKWCRDIFQHYWERAEPRREFFIK